MTNRGIVFVNPRSGPSDDTDDDIAGAFEEIEVVECDPGDVADRVASAAKDGRPWIGIAGGDGTLR